MDITKKIREREDEEKEDKKISDLSSEVRKLFALVSELRSELEEMREALEAIPDFIGLDELDDDEAVAIVEQEEMDPLEASHRRFVLKLGRAGRA